MDARFAETVEFLRARIPVPPVVGVILGSGLGDFAAAVEDRLEIPYAQIPGFPASAVVGHAGTLVAGTLAGVPIVVLSGRIHFYEGHPMSAVVTPARVLGLLGCRDVVVTNAAGGIDQSFSAGDLMLISDHINLFGTNPLIGPNDETFGARFPDMSDAYRSDLRTLAKAAARRVKVPLKEGVYVGVTRAVVRDAGRDPGLPGARGERRRDVDRPRGDRAQPHGRRRRRGLLHHEHGRGRPEDSPSATTRSSRRRAA